jgi:hypothetical protein
MSLDLEAIAKRVDSLSYQELQEYSGTCSREIIFTAMDKKTMVDPSYEKNCQILIRKYNKAFMKEHQKDLSKVDEKL